MVLAISSLTLFLCLENFNSNASLCLLLRTLLTCLRAQNVLSLFLANSVNCYQILICQSVVWCRKINTTHWMCLCFTDKSSCPVVGLFPNARIANLNKGNLHFDIRNMA